MESDELMDKAKELWDTIVRLETEKYDLEERQKRQDYDVSFTSFLSIFWWNIDQIFGIFKQLKELKERQKQQLRQKAMKKGLDPE